MPQLDLFGPVFNAQPTDNKTPQKKAPAKKEEKLAAETTEISASEIAFSEEMLGTNRLKEREDKPPVREEEKKTGQLTPGTISLFDPQPAIGKATMDEDERAADVNQLTVSSEPEILPESYPLVVESDAAIDEKPAELMAAEPTSSITPRFVETPIDEDKKDKIVEEKAPVTERNGAVIFDDGKISVKIKAKAPPSAEETVEKKEKAKKEPQKRGRKSFKEIDASSDLIEVPEDEILFQKQYYPISEVAGWFKVNTSLLRFWENEFDVLEPRKNRKGDRLFRPEDVKNLQLIHHLLRERKYTIDGAKEYIKTHKKKADVQLQLTQTLQKFKSFLLDLKANLQ